MLRRTLLSGVCLAQCAALAACAASNTIRTSADTAIIQSSAAPVCGGIGAAKVAQKQAAVETVKAGFDRYVIVDAASANNVRATALPGSYHTIGTLGGGFYNATTTYRPGPTIIYGSHDQAFAIKMFRNGDPGADRAVSAREMLGPKWPEIVKNGVHTCA